MITEGQTEVTSLPAQQPEGLAGQLPVSPFSGKCQYCGAERFELLFDNVQDRLQHAPGSWRFQRCCHCGSAQLDPLPAEDGMAALYPEVYSPAPSSDSAGSLAGLLKKLEHRVFFGRVYRTQVNRVLKHLDVAQKSNLSLLDVGCGRGLRLLEFAARGWDVLGVDFQAKAVAQLQELGIRATVADTSDLATVVGGERFDVVTAFYCLEHAYDVASMLASCREVLKPGGWFVAACPLVDSLQAKVLGRRWSQVTEAPRHVTIPSQRGLRLLLQQLGFERIKMLSDSAMWCAAMAGQSVLPGSATTFAYSNRRVAAWAVRIAAAFVALGWTPVSTLENYLIRLPGCGIFIARKQAT